MLNASISSWMMEPPTTVGPDLVSHILVTTNALWLHQLCPAWKQIIPDKQDPRQPNVGGMPLGVTPESSGGVCH